MTGIEEIVARAGEARERAYAPYSGFRVGAVVEADDGSLFAGSNVENASLGLTLCAERVAVAAAVTAGHRAFRRLVLVSDGNRAVSPCGACRSVIWEFAPDLPILSVAGGDRREWRMDELLPAPFQLPEPKPSGTS